MKKILGFFSLFVAAVAWAGPPEIILPKTKAIRSVSWYEDQARQWKETLESPAKTNAWLNYYAASRYAMASTADLGRIVAESEKAIPGTYESKVIAAWNEGFTESAFAKLKAALGDQPENSSSYGLLTLFHEFNGEEKERTAFSRKLLESGQVSQALLSYSYNVLMSVDPNAILITEGDNTTLPLFILQDVMAVRTDVIVLDLDMLVQERYAQRKLSESLLTQVNINELTLATDKKKAFCASLPAQNPGRKFYYALTVGRENISDIKNQLYVVGLASQLSKDRIDNISIIRQNLENRFLMDYLTVDFNGESEYAAGRVLGSNYLVPMLLLDDYYVKSGDTERARQLESVVVRLAADGGKAEMVGNFLKKDRLLPEPIYTKIDTKQLEDEQRIIRDNLYAMNTEVKNKQYNAFIDFLITSNQNELYEKCRVDLSKYDETSLAFFKGYHTYVKEPLKGRATDPFGRYPVVNISYEAAVAYCDWLTLQYNHSVERKYKKVTFRLPTIKEWRIAALGYNKFQSWELDENTVPVTIPKDATMEIDKKGKEAMIPAKDISYPWWGAYNYRNKMQNRHNCFLANIKAPENCELCPVHPVGKDGFSMLGFVASYFPNNIGLYDVVGNVAEMTDEKGKACGGSWNHSPEESTIRSINEYAGPDAAIGFRIFMEVIEK